MTFPFPPLSEEKSNATSCKCLENFAQTFMHLLIYIKIKNTKSRRQSRFYFARFSRKYQNNISTAQEQTFNFCNTGGITLFRHCISLINLKIYFSRFFALTRISYEFRRIQSRSFQRGDLSSAGSCAMTPRVMLARPSR